MSNNPLESPDPPLAIPLAPSQPASTSGSHTSTMSNQSSQTIAPQTNHHLGMSSSSPKNEKFSNGNWLAWKTCMAAVLKRKKAYEVVLGITPQPSEPSATAIWEDKCYNLSSYSWYLPVLFLASYSYPFWYVFLWLDSLFDPFEFI